MLTIKTPSKGLVAHGISACHGCGLELVGRIFINTAGRNSVIVIPPGCAALFSGYGNETSVQIPGVQGTLEATAAYAAGIKAGFEIQGRDDINVMGLAGDGATAVRYVREGKADTLFKGHMHTGSFLKAVLDEENGLRTGNLLTQCSVYENPRNGGLLFLTDGSITIALDIA